MGVWKLMRRHWQDTFMFQEIWQLPLKEGFFSGARCIDSIVVRTDLQSDVASARSSGHVKECFVHIRFSDSRTEGR
jgi:hypothetical protein